MNGIIKRGVQSATFSNALFTYSIKIISHDHPLTVLLSATMSNLFTLLYHMATSKNSQEAFLKVFVSSLTSLGVLRLCSLIQSTIGEDEAKSFLAINLLLHIMAESIPTNHAEYSHRFK